MKRAFTLVELLVCVASLGLLASLLLPAAQSARDASRRVQCQSNLHQIWIDVSSRFGHEELITEPSEKSIMQCPAIRESGQGDPQYVYEHAGATRQQLIEHFGRDSIDIAIAYDSWPAHGDVQLGLFLDGHVRALRDGDAK